MFGADAVDGTLNAAQGAALLQTDRALGAGQTDQQRNDQGEHPHEVHSVGDYDCNKKNCEAFNLWVDLLGNPVLI